MDQTKNASFLDKGEKPNAHTQTLVMFTNKTIGDYQPLAKSWNTFLQLSSFLFQSICPEKFSVYYHRCKKTIRKVFIFCFSFVVFCSFVCKYEIPRMRSAYFTPFPFHKTYVPLLNLENIYVHS